MKFKKVKEDDDFIYYENEYGIGAVASKHMFWSLSPDTIHPPSFRLDECTDEQYNDWIKSQNDLSK